MLSIMEIPLFGIVGNVLKLRLLAAVVFSLTCLNVSVNCENPDEFQSFENFKRLHHSSSNVSNATSDVETRSINLLELFVVDHLEALTNNLTKFSDALQIQENQGALQKLFIWLEKIDKTVEKYLRQTFSKEVYTKILHLKEKIIAFKNALIKKTLVPVEDFLRQLLNKLTEFVKGDGSKEVKRKSRSLENEIHQIQNDIDQVRSYKDLEKLNSKILKAVSDLEDIQSSTSSYLTRFKGLMKKLFQGALNYFKQIKTWLKDHLPH